MSSKLVVQVEPERLELRLRGVSALAAGTVYAPVVLEGAGGAVAPVLRLFRDETCADAVAWTSEPASPVPHHSRLHSFSELRLDVQAALDWFTDACDAKTLPSSSRVWGWLVAVDMGNGSDVGPVVLGASRVPVLLHDFSPVSLEPGDSWSSVLAELVAEAIANVPEDATLGGRVSALEENTYTKAEVDAIVAALKTGSRQIVASLSDVTSPQPLVIYMVAKSESQTSNAYDEFIWVDVNGVGRWEKIGDTEIDLSGYAKTADLAAKQDVIADLAAIRSGAAAGATALQDVPIPSTTETLAAEEYSSPDNSVTVDTPSQRGVKLKIRNLLSNTVNTLDTSASGTIATREWVQQNVDVPSPSNDDPSMDDGTAWEGESDEFSRADHVHPTDTSRQASITASGILKGDGSGGVTAAVPGTDYQAPLTASTATPLADGAASAGSSAAYARGDHVHPTDTSRQASITVSGILKGNGSGGVMAAVAGTDYQAALSQTQLNNIAAVPNKLNSSVTDAYAITVESGHLAVTDSQSGAVYTFAGPATNPDDVARGEDLPYVTGLIMDESEGVYFPIDRAVNSYEAADGDTTLTLDMPQPMPVDQGGRARDFVLDVDNSANTGALGLEFSSLGEDYALAVTDGDDLAEITELAAGERARFYFTETSQTFTPTGAQDPIPVISVQRMTIEVVTTQGGA